MSQIAILEGYAGPGGGGRRRRRRKGSRSGRRSGQQGRFAAAARSCRGKRKGAFQACMRKKLKGR
jgi:hypothetical protein